MIAKLTLHQLYFPSFKPHSDNIIFFPHTNKKDRVGKGQNHTSSDMILKLLCYLFHH